MTADLQTLDRFTVRTRYTFKATQLDFYIRGQREPVARIVKRVTSNLRDLAEIRVGRGLQEIAGYASFGGHKVFGPRYGLLGTIESHFRNFTYSPWTIEQNDAPLLVSRAVGVSSIRYVFPFILVPDGVVMPFQMVFSKQGSRAVSVRIRRHTGLRARFSVEVNDPAIDRRLVIAATYAICGSDSADIREIFHDTVNPLR
ncbi:hypothetical protein [Fodinicola acaciae]|uniref:hypothetical protein n=1 Tax=Fodinicola acaciae TaxID=2681555 RepID=UPI0013D84489|nr:hypothetical protein [Fodinicola acaciae]